MAEEGAWTSSPTRLLDGSGSQSEPSSWGDQRGRGATGVVGEGRPSGLHAVMRLRSFHGIEEGEGAADSPGAVIPGDGGLRVEVRSNAHRFAVAG